MLINLEPKSQEEAIPKPKKASGWLYLLVNASSLLMLVGYFAGRMLMFAGDTFGDPVAEAQRALDESRVGTTIELPTIITVFFLVSCNILLGLWEGGGQSWVKWAITADISLQLFGFIFFVANHPFPGCWLIWIMILDLVVLYLIAPIKIESLFWGN